MFKLQDETQVAIFGVPMMLGIWILCGWLHSVTSTPPQQFHAENIPIVLGYAAPLYIIFAIMVLRLYPEKWR